MTRGSVKEYAEAVRERYLKADRKEKTQLLDEFVRVTGYHRKAAIRLLNRGHKLRRAQAALGTHPGTTTDIRVGDNLSLEGGMGSK